ncbi:MAG: ABC transporter permease [Bacteroidales bacterium]|nr:ABC transporter permease [Bacteroidales bacterium]
MNFTFHIARKYLFSGKSHNIINVISFISTLGIMIGTASLIIILSVFNGFEDLVKSLMNTFNPDILVLPATGKVFDADSIDLERIGLIPGVAMYSGFIEDNALARYKNEQYIIKIKGLSQEYLSTGPLDTMVIAGKAYVNINGSEYAILGYLVAYKLGVSLNDVMTPLQLYVPDRRAGSLTGLDPSRAFNMERIWPAGIFSVQQEFDSEYVLVSVDFAKKLFGYKNEVSGLEIRLNVGADAGEAIEKVRKVTGGKFVVKDRVQQQEALYRIMKSEKWAIFFILTFILIVATFNIAGSMTMLILDKRRDISVLFSMGAPERMIRGIFRMQGFFITITGIFGGMLTGGLLCMIQERYGLIRLSDDVNAFVVTHYPVKMVAADFILVFVTVLLIGSVSSWLPTRKITCRYIRMKMHDYLKIQ